MKHRVLILIGLLSLPWTVRAESVFCPEPNMQATVDVGPPPVIGVETIPRSSEPDIGGDYDEKAPQFEWNFINADEMTTPTIAHCYLHKTGRSYVDVFVPPTIKRCIEDKKKFECRSGTFSCIGYVDYVTLEAVVEGQAPQVLEPEVAKTKKGKRQVWRKLDERRNGGRFVVHCSDRYGPDSVQTETIPSEIKECAFANRRFICTDDPNKHDAFWP